MEIPSEIILRVNNISKIYARSPVYTRRRVSKSLGSAFLGRRPAPLDELGKKEFFAVKGVSFALERGKATGIIGLNGSGKTTLLRMLAGQILPDQGDIWINGTSAAMIDLTAGFQASAPGRKNIFMRAAALGFTRRQTEAMADEIIAFSELGDAIDAPMASYSSGMKMRLAFSVMAMVKPDILFIDEVLSVGDFRFKQKCLAKVREMRERSAFVFVSHSMRDIERFCDEVIVMHKGRVYFKGSPSDAIEKYEELDDKSVVTELSSSNAAMGPLFSNDKAITNVETFWCNDKDERVSETSFNKPIRLMVHFTSAIDIRKLIVGVPIWNINAQYTTGISTQITRDVFSVKRGEEVRLIAEIEGGYINPGVVKSMFTVLDGIEFLYRQPNPDLVVTSAPHPTWGVVTLPHRWKRLNVRLEDVT